MTNNFEDNGQKAVILGPQGPGGLTLSAPIRICLPGGEVASAGYAEVRGHDAGWTAHGSVTASDGTRVDVLDEWSQTSEERLALRRTATIAAAGAAAGVRVEL